MILTIEEARDILRIDGTDNDSIIYPLLISIPEYLKVATGKDWNTDTVNPLAKTVAGFLLQLWFEGAGQDVNVSSDRLQRTIDTLLTSLTVIEGDNS